jgi:hypothetical protein
MEVLHWTLIEAKELIFRPLSANFVSDFPASASFLAAHFASSSWLCHLHLQKTTKKPDSQYFQQGRIYVIMLEM